MVIEPDQISMMLTTCLILIIFTSFMLEQALIGVFGPKYWNSIPHLIRSLGYIKHFSKVLKQYLLENTE